MRGVSVMIPPMLMALGTPAAAAQVAPPPAGPPRAEPDRESILVVGRRMPDTAAVVRAAGVISQELNAFEPVARFFGPVCFAALGMEKPFAGIIERRLATVARDAGLTVDPPGCRANVVVRFVDDGAAELQSMRERQGWMFGDAEPSAIDKAVAEPGPVHVWSATQLLNSDGLPGPVREASILLLTKRRDMFYSIVLIDRAAAIGRTLDQLADYAAMRALARIRPGVGTVAGVDTILSLFGSAPPPAGLTLFDRGYLKGLYAGPGNFRSTTKMRQVAGAVRALAAADAVAAAVPPAAVSARPANDDR